MAGPFIPVGESQIHGLSDLLLKLRQLPDNLQKRGLRAAVRKGANIVKTAAVANAKLVDDRLTDEMIFKNVAVQFSARQSKREGGVVIRVGIRGGARRYTATKENVRKGRVGQEYVTSGDKTNPGGDTYYWRFLEFGTSTVSARPFMLPALAQNIERATSAIANELSAQIDKLAVKRV